MKKTILMILTASFMLTAPVSRTWAGDFEHAATAVITGVIGATLIADAITSDVRYHGKNRHRECHRRVWVPGHYETFTKRVWVPEETRRIWVEPFCTFEYRHGRKIKVRHEGYYDCRTIPGRYRTVECERWVEGYWE